VIPAPGWYPDPRPGHSNLQAWWDGRQWHLGATKLTTGAGAHSRAGRCSRFVSGDPLVDGHQRVVIDRTGRECFSVAEGAVVSYQLLGQRPQFGVGGLGAPPQHLEGGIPLA